MPAPGSLQGRYLVSCKWSTLTPSFSIGSLAIGVANSSVDCCDLSRLFGFLIPGRLPRRSWGYCLPLACFFGEPGGDVFSPAWRGRMRWL